MSHHHPILEFLENLFSNGDISTDIDFNELYNIFNHSGIDVSQLTERDLDFIHEWLQNSHHHCVGNEISFGSSSNEQYYLDQAQYYETQARHAYEWYESYLQDHNIGKAESYLQSYHEYKDKAESNLNYAKWEAKKNG